VDHEGSVGGSVYVEKQEMPLVFFVSHGYSAEMPERNESEREQVSITDAKNIGAGGLIDRAT